MSVGQDGTSHSSTIVATPSHQHEACAGNLAFSAEGDNRFHRVSLQRKKPLGAVPNEEKCTNLNVVGLLVLDTSNIFVLIVGFNRFLRVSYVGTLNVDGSHFCLIKCLNLC